MVGFLGEPAAAALLIRAVEDVLAAGQALTPDLGGRATIAELSAAVAATVRRPRAQWLTGAVARGESRQWSPAARPSASTLAQTFEAQTSEQARPTNTARSTSPGRPHFSSGGGAAARRSGKHSRVPSGQSVRGSV
jgi:hypothetical protein